MSDFSPIDGFKPNIVAFVCNWCSYAGADKAGSQKLPYSADVKLIRVMCSGRVDPQFVMKAYREGADGVMVLGCHPGDCHYRNGNLKAMKRFRLLHRTLRQFGIDERRFLLDWVAAGESEKFQVVANGMAEIIRELGPLNIAGRVGPETAASTAQTANAQTANAQTANAQTATAQTATQKAAGDRREVI